MTAALKDKVRDLDADLAICEAAEPGPWRVEGKEVHSMYEDKDGFVMQICKAVPCEMMPLNLRFIAEAREGWPQAIARAMYAEAQLDRARDELRMVQDELNRLQSRGRCID